LRQLLLKMKLIVYLLFLIVITSAQDVKIIKTDMPESQQHQALGVVVAELSHTTNVLNISEKLITEFGKTFGGHWTSLVINGTCDWGIDFYKKASTQVYFSYKSYKIVLFNQDVKSYYSQMEKHWFRWEKTVCYK